MRRYATYVRSDPRSRNLSYFLHATSCVQPTRLASKMVKPEVLSPAGGWPQLRAAVQNGADAVYFGLSNFNARARASNFDPVEDLPQVMEYLHEHGRKEDFVFDCVLSNFSS